MSAAAATPRRPVPHCSLLFTDAIVVTMDPRRSVHSPGYLAIDGDRIVGVGPQAECPYDSADRIVDAAGGAVLPGFVNAHTHSLDLLLRGGLSDDRGLYDWLTNIVDPGCGAYLPEDIDTAVRMFSLEALRSGITTVVDSVEVPIDTWDEVAETMIGVYTEVGLRTVYSQMFYDHIPPALLTRLEAADQREDPYRTDFGALLDLDDALDGIERLMKRHHGAANGRISVWPSPGVAVFCSREAFGRAAELAERHGVMTTVHVCESEVDEFQDGMRGIKYLESIGYLGPDVLPGHCVQLDTGDIRALARSGAKVANNPVSNMFLGNGIAPIAELRTAGVTVGLGTDDANCNGTANMLADLKFAALAQKARYRDAAALTAEQVLEMATIDGAAAIGMADRIGSLEPGKLADAILVDLSGHHLYPRHSVASVLVYQAIGNEVDTVVIGGRVVVDGRAVPWLDAEGERALVARAQATAERVVVDGHLPPRSDQLWRG
jgi:cytosine/adenosine deaminase-related metal-dependent hydrolase